MGSQRVRCNFHFTFSLAGWLPSVASSVRMCVHSKLLQLCLTLCNSMDCGPPGYSVHGIPQEKSLEWVAISYSRGSSQPRDQIHICYVSALAGRFFTTTATWEAPRERIYGFKATWKLSISSFLLNITSKTNFLLLPWVILWISTEL